MVIKLFCSKSPTTLNHTIFYVMKCEKVNVFLFGTEWDYKYPVWKMIYRFILVANWKFWLLHKILTIFGPLFSKKSEFGPKKKIQTIVAPVSLVYWETKILCNYSVWNSTCCRAIIAIFMVSSNAKDYWISSRHPILMNCWRFYRQWVIITVIWMIELEFLDFVTFTHCSIQIFPLYSNVRSRALFEKNFIASIWHILLSFQLYFRFEWQLACYSIFLYIIQKSYNRED